MTGKTLDTGLRRASKASAVRSEGATFSRHRTAVAAGLVAAVWAAISLPTILLSQWFPLDLPAIFFMGARLDEWLGWIASPHSGSGRYFPVYWLYHCLQYPLFGASVWQYLLTQSVLFLFAALLAGRLAYKLTHSFMAAAVVVGAIYLGTPVAENLATVGKGEPLSFLFLMGAVMLAYRQGERQSSSFWPGAALSILFALAIWTKETALVLVGFAGFGAVVSWIAPRLGWIDKSTSPLRSYVWLLSWVGVGLLIAKLPYFLFPKTSSAASYTSYEITPRLVAENLEFYLYQHPDVALFGLLSTGLLLWLRRSRLSERPVDAQAHRDFIFVASLCAMGWGYWLALLVWRWPMAYYMLLPSIVFKIAAVYGLLALRSSAGSGKAYRLLCWGAAVTLLYSALQVYYVTASQIAYSRIYMSALREVPAVAQSRSRLFLDSYPFFAEQIGGTANLVNVQMGLDVRVHGIGELLDPAILHPDLMKLLKVTPADLDTNSRNLPTKGDYVLSFTGEMMALWFLRGVAPYYVEGSLLKAQGSYDLEVVAQEKISFPAWFPHVWTYLPEFDLASVGYKLYKVREDKPRFIWKGRFPDGWIGPEASLVLNDTYRLPVGVKLTVPGYALPAKVTISRDGVPWRTLDVASPEELTIDLGGPPTAHTEISFKVSNSFVPKDVKLNQDKRRLAARVSLSPDPASPTPGQPDR